MKLRDPSGYRELVGLAAIQAAMAARWEACDLSSRFPEAVVPDILMARSERLAESAAGREQLLSLALAAAADDLRHGRAALATGALFWSETANAPEERRRIQTEVFELSGSGEAAADALLPRLEAEHRRDLGADAAATAARLNRDARLHKRLWDDPRLPAEASTRVVMLCSVRRLVDRARALDPQRAAVARGQVARAPRAASAALVGG